jgi:hypothetical protein
MVDSPGRSTSWHKAIVLSSFPSCSDCIAWSDELIAVAGGEVVYFIEHAKNTWDVEAVRVNDFTPQELEVELAPQSIFSIGHEQTSSTVAALAWSGQGLGIHCRPVLAVLTSSHILSIWEYAGRKASYRRTCTVNDTLKKTFLEADRLQSADIISFAWLPALKDSKGGKGHHFLVTIDSRSVLSCFKLAKSEHSSRGQWQIDHLHERILLPDLADPLQGSASGITSQHFDTIHVHAWEHIQQERTGTISNIQISLRRKAFISSVTNGQLITLRMEGRNKKYKCTTEVNQKPSIQISSRITPSAFIDALRQTAAHYDTEFKLQGNYAVRWTGFGESPEHDQIAACVTLHPAAAAEYSQRRHERSTLLIVPTDRGTGMAKRPQTTQEVQLRIFQALIQIVGAKAVVNDIDVKLVRVAIRAIKDYFPQLSGWSPIIQQVASDVDEPCSLCQAFNPRTSNVDFDDGLFQGICSNGHRFYRCGITFLAIQDPGISKCCTSCSRSFLSIEELETESGPSLVRALLNHHDLCPYCQGYFRDV